MGILTIYTTPTCAPCKAIMRQFDAAGIEYLPVDLSADEEALTKLKMVLGRDVIQTPLIRWRSEYHDISIVPEIKKAHQQGGTA